MAAYQGFDGPTGASAHRARDIEAHKRAEEALRLIVEGVFSVTGEQFVRALLGQVGAALRIGVRQQVEEALCLIVDGTSPATGEECFRVLVRHLATALQVRFAFVAELVDPAAQRVRFLSFWRGTDYGKNLEYSTIATPCEDLVRGGLAYYSAGVQELFPDDLWLREIGIESYLAICLVDSSGTPSGFLGAMHDERMDESVPAEPILRIFAARAGVELEHKRATEALREHKVINHVLQREIPNLVIRVGRDGTILDLILASGADLMLAPEESVGRKMHDVLPTQLAQTCMHHMKLALQGGNTQCFEYRLSQLGDTRAHEVRIAVRGGDEVLVVMVDLADRRQAENKLRRSRETLERGLEDMPLPGKRYGLTVRELSVLGLVASGITNKEIALQLGISPATVHKHLSHILNKMRVASRTEAGVRATREGLLGSFGL